MKWTGHGLISLSLESFCSVSALIYELATKNMNKPKNRLAIGIVVAAVLLWLWAELAVGVFTNWGS